MHWVLPAPGGAMLINEPSPEYVNSCPESSSTPIFNAKLFCEANGVFATSSDASQVLPPIKRALIAFTSGPYSGCWDFSFLILSKRWKTLFMILSTDRSFSSIYQFTILDVSLNLFS